MMEELNMLEVKLLEEVDKTVEIRQELIERHGEGNVWNPHEFGQKFSVFFFSAPFVKVKRLEDGKEGYVEFIHYPRFYFDFKTTEGES